MVEGEPVEVTKVVKETVVVTEKVEQEVTRVVEKAVELTGHVKMWAWAETWAEVMVNGFMERNPGVVAEHEIIQNYYDTFLASLVAGAGLPDCAWCDAHSYQKFARTGQLLALDEFLIPYKEDILKFLWDGGLVEGKQYGAPRRYAPEMIWYRKDIFEEAGIDPESIKTWDDLLLEGEKATGNGRYMTCYDESYFDYSLQSMIFSSEGTGFYDSEDNIVVDSPENLALLEKWLQLTESDAVMPVGYWSPDWYEASYRGKVACIIMPYWFGNGLPIETPENDNKWGILPIPSISAGVQNASVWQGAMFWTIPTKAENPELAWKLIEYTSYDPTDITMQESYDLELVLPAYTPYMETDFFWSKALLYFGENLRKKAHGLAQGAPTNYMPPEYSESEGIFSAQAQKMVAGDMTPDQVLATSAEEFKKLLEAR
jgi:lactose/L-arabinose transport system substrate-binding protein